LTISNVNAPRQYTVAGDEDALDIAESRLRELKPRRLVRLNVAGAWHTPLLGAAAEELERRLAAFELRLPAQPVADNVTGGMLPDEPRELRLRLAEHVAAPVQWQACVKSLIAAGAAELVEVGYGSMLTKFGPFIDRSVAHRAFLDE
jgi:[acyl-carrier-protein] S-malonyltransferase